MNLFPRISLTWPWSAKAAPADRGTAAEDARDAVADEIRTPGQLAAYLSNWSGSDGDGGLKDPYRLSPWVSRAIKHIAGPIAQVSLEFHQEGPQGKVEVNDPELNGFWNRPAKAPTKRAGQLSRLSRYDVIEATVGWLTLCGEFFWILDDTWLSPKTRNKSPFIIARPDRMLPILDDGELIGWRFRDGMGRSHDLIPDQVVTSRLWNPYDDTRGCAPMDSAEMAAAADYASARFWKSLAESNGDLGDTVIAPNGVSETQREQIKLAMLRKRRAAKRGRFEPMFLIGDVKTEEAKIKSPDASAVTQRLENRHEVFVALGVPPSFADVTASYSIGSASDRFKLIEETCMPAGAKIAEAVEVVEWLRTGRTLSAAFNFDDHSTMQQVRAERIEAGRKLHERGVPWNVVSDHLNLSLKPFAGWDKAWLPMNLEEVKGDAPAPVAAPVAAPAPAEASAGMKAIEELEELLKGCPVHDHRTPEITPRAADEKRIKRWENLMKTRAPFVKKARVIVDRALFNARAETLRKIAEAEKAEKAIRAGAFDFLFDLTDFLNALVKPLFKVSLDSYQAAGDELLKDELGSDDPFIVPDPNGIRWLKGRENFIQDAATSMWEETRDSLEQGIQDGESFDKLAARVREVFNGMSRERSMRIAVTETGIAFEGGRHDAMIQAGAEWKEWLTSQDDRVRITHSALDGTRVPMAEPFIVGGVPMMFPCDPEGTPAEIVNCRCVHGPADSPENPEGTNNDPTVPF